MPISPALHSKPLTFLRALVRWNEWYDSKIAFLLLCMYYVALSQPNAGGWLQAEMGILLAALCAYASFGHMINDFSDRQTDRAAGKRNVLADLSERRALALLVAAGAVGAIFVLPYWQRPGVVALFGFAYALAAFYSLPPLRLKERGAAGLVAAALAQRTIPCLIVFSALNFWDWTALALCALGTLVGFRYIVVHQILDAYNDARSGIKTFGTTHGADSLSAILTRILFPLELMCLGAAILLMGRSVPAVWVMGPLYALWLFVQRKRQPHRRMSPISYSLLADLYFVYWPLLLALVLALRDLVFIGVLAFTIAWLFRNLSLLIANAIAGFPGRKASQSW
jgi:4-hydroxybenzoate polyprenyltransferase